jgi:hypothetical protein
MLVAFGAAAGRHRYMSVEAPRHYPNEFCVLVGASQTTQNVQPEPHSYGSFVLGR